MPSFLISGSSGSGKRTIIKTVAKSLGIQLLEISCRSLIGESTKATEMRIQNAFQSAHQVSPAFLYLTDIEVDMPVLTNLDNSILVDRRLFHRNFIVSIKVLGNSREGSDLDFRILRYFVSKVRENRSQPAPTFIIGGCVDHRKCSPDIYAALLHKIAISPLSIAQRTAMYQWILNESNVSIGDLSLDDVARKSHCFQFGDLNAVVSIAARFVAF